MAAPVCTGGGYGRPALTCTGSCPDSCLDSCPDDGGSTAVSRSAPGPTAPSGAVAALVLLCRRGSGHAVEGTCRECDRDHEAGRPAAAQHDRGAQAGGEPAHDEQPQPLRHRDLGHRRMGDLLVGLGDLFVGHAQAVVRDGQVHTVSGHRGGDHHPGLRVGEVRRVLEQLGQQVSDGQRVPAGDVRVLGHRQVDPVVRLDLAHGCPDDVRQRQRPAQPAGRVDAGEDEQALGVAAHPGREVVQRVQAGEDVGVLLAGLHLVQLRELAPEQHLVASRDVDEHLRDAGAERGLLLGDLDGHVVDGVERLGEATDLVGGLHRDRLDDHTWPLAGDLHPLDHARQLVADLSCGDGEAAQRAGDPAGQVDGEQEGQQQAQHGADDEQQRALLLAALGVGGQDGDAADHVGLGVGHRTDPGVGRADPLHRPAVVGPLALEQVGEVAPDLVDLGVLGGGERVRQGREGGRRGAALEVGERAALLRHERGGLGEVGFGHGAAQQGGLDDVALVRRVLDGGGDRLVGLQPLGERRRAGRREDPRQVEVGPDDLRVEDVGLGREEPAGIDRPARTGDLAVAGCRPGDAGLDGGGHRRDRRLGHQPAQGPQLLVGELTLTLHPGPVAGGRVLQVAEGGAALLLEGVHHPVHLDGHVREGVHLPGLPGSAHLAADEKGGHHDEQKGRDGEDSEELGAHPSVTKHG